LERLNTACLRSCLAVACAEQGYSLGLPVRQMETLEQLDLVRRHLTGWMPTWLGHGVNNWRRQLEASLFRDPTLPVPEPLESENGEQPGAECNHYRELYFLPGICWCLRPARSHPSQLAQLAMEFLAWHNENQRSQRLQSQGSGRNLVKLLPRLHSLDRTILMHLFRRRSETVQLGELAIFYACLVDFFSLKASVDRLHELELLDSRPSLVLTWDGRGVCQWMKEVELSRRRGVVFQEPRPGENGIDPQASACAEFRGLLQDSELCWCGWRRMEHVPSGLQRKS